MNWKQGLTGAAALAVGVLAVTFLRPAPVAVDLAVIARGPLEVTIDDDARTRIRSIYTVSAPLAGKVLRTPYRVGDSVVANESVVAVMQPALPAFHDARTHQELTAALAAADAAVVLAESEIRRIEAALTLAQSDLGRAQTLARTGAIAPAALDTAVMTVDTNEAALASAHAQLLVRRNERASVAARADVAPAAGADGEAADCCIQIPAPVSGQILALAQESEAIVPAGASLVDIGDPADLEIVAELLSSDAVQIQRGAPVRIDGWGGPPLQGRVARVEPVGFRKVSALGIEEQRVRTIIDFTQATDSSQQLGHDYGVVVHVIISSSAEVLTVPTSALFRSGDAWAVFAVKEGRATLTLVEIGQSNGRVAEVRAGLAAGAEVVLHPSDRVGNGTRVAQRDRE